jgi:hypothetical protein
VIFQKKKKEEKPLEEAHIEDVAPSSSWRISGQIGKSEGREGFEIEGQSKF